MRKANDASDEYDPDGCGLPRSIRDELRAIAQKTGLSYAALCKNVARLTDTDEGAAELDEMTRRAIVHEAEEATFSCLTMRERVTLGLQRLWWILKSPFYKFSRWRKRRRYR